MTWTIDLPNLRASHTSGLQVNLVRNAQGRYLFQPVEDTKHYLDTVPDKKACIAELGAQLYCLVKQRH
jgi:hypothetical protein